MKQKIIKIAQDLKQGTITTKTARTLLLGLFGVSGSALDERMDEEFDIVKCKHCGSTDIIGTHTKWWCSDCGKTCR